jgi:hypothetical protein
MTQYEVQVLPVDAQLLLEVREGMLELVPASRNGGKAYAALHTDSLATLNTWREVLEEGSRPHRLVNHAYGHRQEANGPDW